MKRRSLSHRVAFCFLGRVSSFVALLKRSISLFELGICDVFLSGIVRIFAKIQEFEMKKDIHPEYREVLFTTRALTILVDPLNNAIGSNQGMTDGNTYPYCPRCLAASHPFYTESRD